MEVVLNNYYEDVEEECVECRQLFQQTTYESHTQISFDNDLLMHLSILLYDTKYKQSSVLSLQYMYFCLNVPRNIQLYKTDGVIV